MIAVDWQQTSEGLGAAYRAEAARTRADLFWDTEPTWEVIEQARRLGQVAGRIVRDAAGRWRGWSYFLAHRGSLQIGSVTADDEEATRVLLASVLSSPEAHGVSRVLLYAYAAAPGLIPALRAQGFDIEPQHYLMANVAASMASRDEPPEAEADALSVTLDELAQCLAACYPTPDPRRPFAPGGTSDEWAEYVRALTQQSGCGMLLPGVSQLDRASDGRLQGVALVTHLGPQTAHLAQLAVLPQLRRAGRAGRLLQASMRAAADAGHQRMTLLVSERNAAAMALYTQAGFVKTAEFVSAVRLTRAD
jgi:ribosomal protein S18 acetylase RimI-like enzyme